MRAFRVRLGIGIKERVIFITSYQTRVMDAYILIFTFPFYASSLIYYSKCR